MGIPSLFEDKEKTIRTQEWYSLLSQSADDYNCAVKTLTHVRSFRPMIFHEYLQAIIEDLDTGNCTRLIAERQTSQDQKPFTLSSSSGPSGGLSLPLYSVNFDSNLKVMDLAGILAETTKIGDKDNLITMNCHWFVITAYQSLKLKISGPEEHEYFFNWRGSLILSKKSVEGKANDFEEERNNKMKWAPGNSATTWEFLEEVYKSSIRLSVDSSEEAENLSR
ncbi:uncharacterized protein FTOL_03815 [Fusarium torulosum]|uniref:Uncharacterized protein n=1 Tax=Fusarium torulosum TaxID=33205 RepID=A0AAE8SFM9_9HYPO|nr:uncharacterized protein FTOL_03815 [Fusarium torulosum]